MKILAIPYTHTLSHISRPLLVAQELSRRGHEVVFAGESPKTKFIQQAGFKVLPLHEPEPEELFGNIRKGRLRFASDAEIMRMIDADVALFKEVKPDLVLTDGRFSAPISTHITGLRHVAIVNVSSTEYRALPYIPLFDWIPASLTGNTWLGRRLDLLNLALEMRVFDNTMNIFKKLSRDYGLKKPFTATNCLTGKDISLLADIPEYFPTRDLPRNFHYIGPLTWKSSLPPPAWWPPEKGNKPLVYVTMGTTGIGDFFKKAYDLFRVSDMVAVITTGAQAQELETTAGSIYSEAFIDGDLMMEECDVVVCHGGNGTIYQALQHGKPVIGIPTIPDQKFNMRRIVSLGLGTMLSWKEFSRNPESLLEAIHYIAKESSFRQNAARFSKILSTYNAPKTAVDLIENWSA